MSDFSVFAVRATLNDSMQQSQLANTQTSAEHLI